MIRTSHYRTPGRFGQIAVNCQAALRLLLLYGTVLQIGAIPRAVAADAPAAVPAADAPAVSAPLPEGAILRMGGQPYPTLMQVRALSPNGRMLATTGLSEVVELWNTGTHRQFGRISDGKWIATALDFSHDGKKIAASARNHVRVWDLTESQRSFDLETPLALWLQARFSADNSQVITLSQTAAKRVELRTVELSLPKPGGAITLARVKDNAYLSSHGSWVAWFDREGKQVGYTLAKPDSPVFSVALPAGTNFAELRFSRSDRWLVINDRQGKLLVRDLQDEKFAVGWEHGFAIDKTQFALFAVADNYVVQTGLLKNDDGTTYYAARVRDIATGKLLRETKLSARFAAEGRPALPDTIADGRVALRTRDGAVAFWDWQKDQWTTPPESDQPATPAKAFFYLAEKNQWATIDELNQLVSWDAVTGKQQLARDLFAGEPPLASRILAASGNRLADADIKSTENRVRIRRLDDGKSVATITTLPYRPVFLRWLMDERALLIVDQSGNSYLWDAEKRTLAETGHVSLERSLAMQPISKARREDYHFRELEFIPSTGRKIELPPMRQAAFPIEQEAQVSADGTRLAMVCAAMATVSIWNVENRTLLRTLPRRFSDPRLVRFSPDSRFLVSIQPRSSRIDIWDAKTCANLGGFETMSAGVDQMTFSKDGRQLATLLANGQILAWDFGRRHPLQGLQPEHAQADELTNVYSHLITGSDRDHGPVKWALVHAGDASVEMIAKRLGYRADPKTSEVFVKLAPGGEKPQAPSDAPTDPPKPHQVPGLPNIIIHRPGQPTQYGIVDRRGTVTSQQIHAIDVLEWINTDRSFALLKALANHYEDIELAEPAEAAMLRMQNVRAAEAKLKPAK